MLEPLSLSIVPFISSFQCSCTGDFLVIHALVAHDRRPTADLDLAASSHLALLQRTADNGYSFNKTHKFTTLMAKATPISCKISCGAVAKQSAETCDFLATLTRSQSTVDGELQAFLHTYFIPLFQTTTDIPNRSSMNTQTRI